MTNVHYRFGDLELASAALSRDLVEVLARRTSRKDFFYEFAQLLQRYFSFDRLCINLYNNQEGMLSYFTNAQGRFIRTIAPTRPAETSRTVAAHVIANQRPIIITDFSKYFTKDWKHPIEESGLKVTIAIPLFLNSEIFGTLHCSFARQPKEIEKISALLIEVCKTLAPCIAAILCVELASSLPHISPYQPPASHDAILYKSEAMKNVMESLKAVAECDFPVILLGETGTGKSVMAKHIHLHSRRSNANFVKVNCPAVSPSLFESELFGHIKGAFTGAFTKRIGRFELANQGTLFLDEIGDLSMEMQSKLLQVLEESRFERVGESTSLAVDVRLISATNVSIREAIAGNRMRPDLYHRLSGYVIEIPPLRERREDIPLYIKVFSNLVAHELGVNSFTFDKWLVKALCDYHWPGNVRELKNIISRLLIFKKINRQITPGALATIMNSVYSTSVAVEKLGNAPLARIDAAQSVVEAMTENNNSDGLPKLQAVEKAYITKVLEHTHWVVSGQSGAAKIIGIPRSTLMHKMKKLGIKHRLSAGV